jgi:hypothetical protein
VLNEKVNIITAVHVPPLNIIEPNYNFTQLPGLQGLSTGYPRFSASVVNAHNLLVKGCKRLESENI